SAARRETQEKMRQLTADLPNRFPPAGEYEWHVARPESVASAGGATVEKLDDGAIKLSGTNPDNDTYTVIVDTDIPRVGAIRIEALVDPQLPSTGPGRTPHGNFVLSELTVEAALKDS